MASINEHESAQIDRANASGKTPVMFIHGLWLLPSSWDNWAKLFEEAGYTALMPGWPDDPETVGEAQQHPEVFARKTVGQVADHFEDVSRKLDGTPVVIGIRSGGCWRRSSPGAASRRPPSRSTRRRSAGSCRCRSRR